jgi:enamine deaminase RidA (YjgF/YER057c/UK114 family)
MDGNVVGVGDMGAQIEQVGRNLQACLAAAGATLDDLVKTTTYVADIDLFFKYPEVRARFLGTALPTSTTVEVRRLAHPDFLVEIDGIAIVDD